MPIYEYVCEDCGSHYEKIVMNASTAVACPECDSEKQTQQLSVFAAPASASKEPGGFTPYSGGGCGSGGCGCH